MEHDAMHEVKVWLWITEDGIDGRCLLVVVLPDDRSV
jgi:hypothetical protein